MKKLVFALLMVLSLVSMSHAVEIGDLKGKVIISGLHGTDTNYENRINIIPELKYKPLIYRGDYNLDFNDQQVFTKTQQKTLVGLELYNGISFRYQYENMEQDKFITTPAKLTNGKLIPAKTTIKDIQTYENRYGGGYENIYKNEYFTVKNDVMILKEEIADIRFEYAIDVNTEYFKVRNQLYYDYIDGYGLNPQKYFDKMTLTYKLNKNTGLTYQANWISDKVPVHRLGLSVNF